MTLITALSQEACSATEGQQVPGSSIWAGWPNPLHCSRGEVEGARVGVRRESAAVREVSRTANPIYHCLVHGTMALLAQDLPALWTRWCTHHTHASLGALAHTLDTGTGGLSLPPTASDWQWSQSQRFFLKPYNSVNMNGMLTEACNENMMATTKMLCKFSGLFRCPLCFHVLTVFSGYI